jgi:hypothetical protein
VVSESDMATDNDGEGHEAESGEAEGLSDHSRATPLRNAGELTAADRPTLDERQAFFAAEMLANRFITGVTVKQYAAQWGLHIDTVKRDAAAASKLFRADPKEADDRKSRGLAKLEGAQEAARAAGRHEAVKGLLELEAKAGGYMEPEKHEHTHLNADARAALLERIAGSIASETPAGEAGEDHPGAEPGGS